MRSSATVDNDIEVRLSQIQMLFVMNEDAFIGVVVGLNLVDACFDVLNLLNDVVEVALVVRLGVALRTRFGALVGLAVVIVLRLVLRIESALEPRMIVHPACSAFEAMRFAIIRS